MCYVVEFGRSTWTNVGISTRCPKFGVRWGPDPWDKIPTTIPQGDVKYRGRKFAFFDRNRHLSRKRYRYRPIVGSLKDVIDTWSNCYHFRWPWVTLKGWTRAAQFWADLSSCVCWYRFTNGDQIRHNNPCGELVACCHAPTQGAGHTSCW